MGRHQKAIRGQFKNYFQKVTRIKAKDGATIGFDIADPGEARIYSCGRGKIRDEKNGVDFSDSVVPLVDGTYLRCQNKTTGGGPGSRKGIEELGERTASEFEESRFGRLQIFLQLLKPAGVSEVTGANDVNPLDCTPCRKAFQVARLTRRPGKGGMDMQVGYVAHSSAGTAAIKPFFRKGR